MFDLSVAEHIHALTGEHSNHQHRHHFSALPRRSPSRRSLASILRTIANHVDRLTPGRAGDLGFPYTGGADVGRAGVGAGSP